MQDGVEVMRTIWLSPGWFAGPRWRSLARGRGVSKEDLQWMEERRRKWVAEQKKEREKERKWLARFRARRKAMEKGGSRA